MRALTSVAAAGLVALAAVVPGGAIAAAPDLEAAADIELIDPGAEPRRPLRFAWSPGSAETAAITMTMEMSASMDGTPFQAATTTMAFEFAVTTSSVDADGTAVFEFMVRSMDLDLRMPGLDDETSEELAELSRAMVGLTGREVRDARGRTVDWDLDLPPAFPAELRDQLAGTVQSLAVFPEEAVGVGARWATTAAVTSGGLEMEQTTVTTVVAIDDASVRLEQSTSGFLDDAAIAGWIEGVEATIDAFTLDGGGASVVEFARVFPTSQTHLAIHLVLTMEIGPDQDPFSMEMDVAAAVDVSS